MNILRRHTEPTGITLSGPNLTEDEFAEELQKAQASSPDVQRQQDAQALREQVVKRAADAGRLMVTNSEVSGEVPMITPGMERPKD